MRNKVFLGIGSNKGDRLNYISKALNLIKGAENCYILNISSIYETEPYGNKNQQNFYNAVTELETNLWLKDFFFFIKNIEFELGRSKSEKWGPREIDLDILFFNDFIYEDQEIIIPHPDVLNRDFVLRPLLEINSNIIHPKLLNSINKIDLSKLDNHILTILPDKLL